MRVGLAALPGKTIAPDGVSLAGANMMLTFTDGTTLEMHGSGDRCGEEDYLDVTFGKAGT